MISNCGHDENNKYSGGKAGDQTGGEWTKRSWYNRPWLCVIRHPDEKVRNLIAKYAKAAAENDKIGYDQNDRLTFWGALKNSKYDPAKITTKCEADCSSGVAAIVKAVGYTLDISDLKNVSEKMYTGNERSGLKKAGFSVYTASKYLTSDKYLLPGDILLYDPDTKSGHTAINLDTGSSVKAEDEKIQNGPKKSIEEIAVEVINGKWGNGAARKSKLIAAGYDYDAVQKKVNEKLKGSTSNTETYTTYKVVNVKSYLNVRASGSTTGKIVGKLYNGDTIKVKKISGGWAQLESGNWVSTNYIKKA